MELIYKSDEYFQVSDHLTIGYGDYFADEAVYRPYFRDRLRLLERYCRPPGRLFEIGAAAGYALDEAQRLGWSVEGSELSPAAAEFARRNYRVAVEESSIEELKADSEYDAVVSFQTIEHFADIRAGLMAMRRALKPGGVVLLTTPDHGSILRKVMRRYWISYRPEHLTYFDQRTIRVMMVKVGFDVELVESDRSLLVPIKRLVERAVHFYAPRIRHNLVPLPSWRVPILLGDMVVIARRR